MLQGDTHDRLALGALCDKLKDLLERAHRMVETLPNSHSRTIDDAVLAALSQQPDNALRERSREPKTRPLRSRMMINALNASTFPPSSADTSLAESARTLTSISVTPKPYCKELPKVQLGQKITEKKKLTFQGVHAGAMTDSPLALQSASGNFQSVRSGRPKNLDYHRVTGTVDGREQYPPPNLNTTVAESRSPVKIHHTLLLHPHDQEDLKGNWVPPYWERHGRLLAHCRPTH